MAEVDCGPRLQNILVQINLSNDQVARPSRIVLDFEFPDGPQRTPHRLALERS